MTPADLDALMGELPWPVLAAVLAAADFPVKYTTEGWEGAERLGLVAGGEVTDLGDAIVARLREIAASIGGGGRDRLRTLRRYEPVVMTLPVQLERKGLVVAEATQFGDRTYSLTPLGRAVAAVSGEVNRA